MKLKGKPYSEQIITIKYLRFSITYITVIILKIPCTNNENKSKSLDIISSLLTGAGLLASLHCGRKRRACYLAIIDTTGILRKTTFLYYSTC